MVKQKEHVLKRCSEFCTSSNQSLDFLLHIGICSKHIFCFLHNLEISNVYKYMEKADLVKHFAPSGFPRCHI